MERATLAWLAAVALQAGMARAADWPQWRGPNRNGVSAESAFARDWNQQAPKTLWKAAIGIGFSSVAVADGLAYASGNREATDALHAFEAATGKLRWRHAYPCDLAALRHEGGPYATPTVAEGRVYQLSKLGHLWCLDAKTGRVLWQANVPDATGGQAPNYGYAGSPLVAGDRVILNSGSAGAAFDTATGQLAWKSDESCRAGHASPLLWTGDGPQAVFILSEDLASGVDPATGRVLWQRRLPREGRLHYKIADPILVGDRFFVTASYGDVCALYEVEQGTVRRVWTRPTLFSKFLNPVHLDGLVVCGHRERRLHGIALATGDLKWEADPVGNAIVAGDLCLVLTLDGELLLAEVTPRAFRELARARILAGKCWTPPALADRRLYARNARGDLVCVALPAGAQSHR